MISNSYLRNINMTLQGKSKLMEGGTKLRFPLDCHFLLMFLLDKFSTWVKCLIYLPSFLRTINNNHSSLLGLLFYPFRPQSSHIHPCGISPIQPDLPGKTDVFPKFSTFFQIRTSKKVSTSHRGPIYQIKASKIPC